MALPAYEKLGVFYLGREYDPATQQLGPELLYDARDLTTHAVCIGMTGSGKTGLCLSLLEEAAIDGIPAIAIDPKGDIANLALTFPELRPEDFKPWVDPGEAARKGQGLDEFAASTAAAWRNGLAEWDQDGARILPRRIRPEILRVATRREVDARHPSVGKALGGLHLEAEIVLVVVRTIAVLAAVAGRQAGFTRRVVGLVDGTKARNRALHRAFQLKAELTKARFGEEE